MTSLHRILAATWRVDLRAVGDIALHLLAGGMVILALVVLLVLLRAVLPARPTPVGGVDRARTLRGLRSTPPIATTPLGARARVPLDQDRVEAGRQAWGHARAPDVDAILNRVADQGRGEPRLLQLDEARAHVRIYHCRECEGATPRASGPGMGCSEQAGYLLAGFRHVLSPKARIQETRCRGAGNGACDFEVHA